MSFINHTRLIALSVFIVGAFTRVEAASFDCAKAVSPTEKKICSNSGMSKLDEELADAYKKASDATSDKETLQRNQTKWLRRRDRCFTDGCIVEMYKKRIDQLNAVVKFSKQGAGHYSCRSAADETNWMFTINDGVIDDFLAQSSAMGEDLAKGYTMTCMQGLTDFSQTESGKVYALQYTRLNDQFGESINCKVIIEDLGTTFRARSSNCVTECLQFNFEIAKEACREIQK